MIYIQAIRDTIVYNGEEHQPSDGPFEVDSAYAARVIEGGKAVRYQGVGPDAPEGSLSFLKKSLVELLAKNGIVDVETAMEAGVDGLAAIKGIGKTTAKRIVDQINKLYE